MLLRGADVRQFELSILQTLPKAFFMKAWVHRGNQDPGPTPAASWDVSFVAVLL